MDVNERFEKRQIGREEYHALHRSYRQNCTSIPGGDLSFHFFMFSQYRAHDRLPAQYQYRAVSDDYAYHMTMLIADYGGSLYEAELERRVSLYHLGYEEY